MLDPELTPIQKALHLFVNCMEYYCPIYKTKPANVYFNEMQGAIVETKKKSSQMFLDLKFFFKELRSKCLHLGWKKCVRKDRIIEYLDNCGSSNLLHFKYCA